MLASPTSGGPAGPVFVDRSGRRRRLIGRAGVVVAGLGVAYAATLVALSLTGAHIDGPRLPAAEQVTHLLRSQPDTPGGSARAPRRATSESTRVVPAVDAVSSAGTGGAASSVPTTGARPALHGSPAATPTRSASATTSPTGSPIGSPTTSPTRTASATPTGTGRSALAPGATRRPTPSTGGNTDAPGRTRATTRP